MMRRRRPLLRAAAVGGGAYMAGKHVANKQAAQSATDASQDQQLADMQSQPAPAPAPVYAAPPSAPVYAAPPPAEPQSNGLDELQKLGEMHEQGILTDEEFAAAKQKILRNM